MCKCNKEGKKGKSEQEGEIFEKWARAQTKKRSLNSSSTSFYLFSQHAYNFPNSHRVSSASLLIFCHVHNLPGQTLPFTHGYARGLLDAPIFPNSDSASESLFYPTLPQHGCVVAYYCSCQSFLPSPYRHHCYSALDSYTFTFTIASATWMGMGRT